MKTQDMIALAAKQAGKTVADGATEKELRTAEAANQKSETASKSQSTLKQPKTQQVARAETAKVPAKPAITQVVESSAGAGARASASWQDNVPTGNRSVASKGLVFVFGFLALFFAWAFLFPISSAVVAEGRMVSAGANKLIQHPIGGVVREIFVRDGDVVEQGKVLLTLDQSINKAELSRLTARTRLLNALKTRLEAEQGGKGFAEKPKVAEVVLRGAEKPLDAAGEAEVNRLLEEQRREFEAGRKRLKAEQDAFRSQIEGLKDSRSGLQARLSGERQQLALTQDEIRRLRPLVTDGLVARNRLAEIDGRRLQQISTAANLEAEIDSTSQRIAEAEAQLARVGEADKEQRSEELTKVYSELAEIRDQLTAADLALNDTDLKAPVSGTITNMAANTVGGVVRAGDVVAEIVPKGSELITEFRVPLEKVKSVVVGQNARVVVTAFNRRTYDPIEGEVVYVSADQQEDTQTGEKFFLARAKLKASEDPEKVTGIGEIQAGMSTQVFALSKPRVFMDYLLQPIYDSFSKAFRETT